jgi:hypothetical protein
LHNSNSGYGKAFLPTSAHQVSKQQTAPVQKHPSRVSNRLKGVRDAINLLNLLAFLHFFISSFLHFFIVLVLGSWFLVLK